MKFIPVICLLLSLDLSFAQDKFQDHTCRILFLKRPREVPQEMFLFDGTASQKVELPSMNFSPVYTLKGGDIVLHFSPNTINSSEEIPSGAPRVEIPARIVDFYLLIAHDPENKVAPIKALVIDVGNEKIKAGETLWINLTPHTIAAKLGSEIITVNPNSRLVGKPPLITSGYYNAEFQFMAKDTNTYQPLMKKSWWLDINSKNLGFIYDNGTHIPKIVSFRDQRDLELEKKEEE